MILRWLVALVVPYLTLHGLFVTVSRWAPSVEQPARSLLRPAQLAAILLVVHLAAPVLSANPQSAILIAERSRWLLFPAGLWLLVRIVVSLVFDVYSERVRGITLPRIYRGVLAFALALAAAFAVLELGLGYELRDVLLLFALLALVLGVTLQSLVRRLLTGIGIALRGEFGVGDTVRVAQYEGLVETIDWHATTLRTRSGDAVVVPNELLAASAVVVFDRPVVSVRIPVGTDARPTEVCAMLEECARGVEGVLEDPPPTVDHGGWEGSHALYDVTVWVDRYFRVSQVESSLRAAASYRLRRGGIALAGMPALRADDGAAAVGAWLLGVPLFAALGANELERLQGMLTVGTYGKGEVLFRHGESGSSIYLVKSGSVEIRLPRGASEIVVSKIQKGGFFGERSLLTGEPRSATAVAAEDCDLIVVDKSSLHGILLANPAVAERLSEIMIERDAQNRALSDAAKAAERNTFTERILAFFGIGGAP